jgi:hypothetical protein
MFDGASDKSSPAAWPSCIALGGSLHGLLVVDCTCS